MINNGGTPLERSKEDNEGGDIAVTEEDKKMAVKSIQVLAGVVSELSHSLLFPARTHAHASAFICVAIALTATLFFII